jgi:hypothetical protein
MAYLSDSQQKEVYLWEQEWPQWNKQSLSRQACRKLILQVCQLYAVPAPKMAFLKRGKLGLRQGWRTEYDPNVHAITLAPQHQNLAIVLHEVAHLVHSVIAGDEDHEIHGPEWLALYMYLLARYGAAPRAALFATAKAFDLRWKSLDKHNSVRIRRTYRAIRRREQIET